MMSSWTLLGSSSHCCLPLPGTIMTWWLLPLLQLLQQSCQKAPLRLKAEAEAEAAEAEAAKVAAGEGQAELVR